MKNKQQQQQQVVQICWVWFVFVDLFVVEMVCCSMGEWE